MITHHAWRAARSAAWLAAASAMFSCSDGEAGAPGDDTTAAKYAVSSAVFSPEGTTTTVSILDSVAAQEIDYDRAWVFPGWADMWVHEGDVFVSDGESPVITKFEVAADGSLVEVGRLSFAAYGEIDAAFWSNTFVSPTKSYMINGTAEYVIWNPSTMTITGSLALPTLEDRMGLRVRAGTMDRSNVIRDGLLYQPMYWSDEDYTQFAPDSRIVVIDIASDQVVRVIEAPCAGLDVGTQDAAGDLYFSTWTSGVYSPLVLGTEPNCVARIRAGETTATAAFTYASVAEGREGAAVRASSDGRLVFSAFHDERVDLAGAADPWELIGQDNWRLWVYDPATGAASVIDSIDWNSGATYMFELDGRTDVLVPAADAASSRVYALDGGVNGTPLFDTRGWAMRLFKVR